MAILDFMGAQPGSEGISGLDPGKLQFLAQIGASLDPEGFAGGVGQATSQAIGAKQFQKAAAKSEAGEESRFREILKALGVTPKGTPGVDSVNFTADGVTTKTPITQGLEGNAPLELEAAAPAPAPTAPAPAPQGGEGFSPFSRLLLGL